MDADLDTLATALYVTTDDFLIDNPQHRPWRPKVGIPPRLEDAELVTLVVLQALLGFTSEARWLRYADSRLRGLFPYARRRPEPARDASRSDVDGRQETTTAGNSKPRSPTPVSTCCAPPARERNPAPDNASSSRCGRSSNRSTTPSRPKSTSSATEDEPSPESPHASCNASSPSPPPSGTTTEPTSRSCDH